MEYTVQKLAALAGVSARTLRYYDGIGLLKPARTTPAGYRIYGAAQVDRLQQIRFYRELGVPLEEIGALLRSAEADRLGALRGHEAALLRQRERLDALIRNVRRSIAAEERGIPMEDHAKFEGFKRSLVEENERAYGAEIRAAYGDAAVEASNAKLLGLTEEEYGERKALEQQVLTLLDEAFAIGDPGCDAARRLVDAHRRWLDGSWATYSATAHRNLGEMYPADERFAAYYDRGTPGKAAFLRDALHRWLPEDGEGGV